ncbi:MAG: Molybdopterin oxidoreductase, membrane subunit PsrC/NrfD [Candidatus Kapaibacterium sp.]|nr:MAG: Molybdopterin oxidoreductase, membrane subunit PsrC/NrfD [Candidatus Kapabacteria bacterium]
MKRVQIRKIIIGVSLILLFLWIGGIIYTFAFGLKSWGLTSKTVWGVEIVNFVFWIGNSHAGTLISAILYLLRQDWRKSIHRIAETFTIISILIAGIYPLLHLGRPWLFYWMFPIPNQMQTWANFKSPLIWDFIAILTYIILSFLFLTLGIIPDYDKIKFKKKNSLGNAINNFFEKIWLGSLNNWNEYKWTYHIFAGILTFVVISVHSIVSYDFSVSILPQWHSTMLPVFFVVGAIYSGVALLLICTTLLNSISSFGKRINQIALNNLSKMLLGFSLVFLYFYILELFFQFYSQNQYEQWIYSLRFQNEYKIIFFIMCILIFAIPQFFWFRKLRENKVVQFLIALSVLVGMWLERYILIVPVLSADFVTKQTINYTPSLLDIILTFGSLGFFVIVFYAIGKRIPMVPIYED